MEKVIGLVTKDLGELIERTKVNLKTVIKAVNVKGYAMADGITNDAPAIQQAISEGSVIWFPDGDYLINNSLAAGIVVNKDNVKLTGSPNARLIATDDLQDLIKVTGKNVTIEGITLVGNGVINENVQTEERPALLKVDGTGLTSSQHARVLNVRFERPSVTGLQLYRCVGALIQGCTFFSDAPTSTPFTHLLNLALSAYVQIVDNQFEGFAEGIIGTGSTTITFDSFDGEVAGQARKIIIKGNELKKQTDHGIYFSDNTKDYVISGNIVKTASNGIKVEGYNIIVSHNEVDEGIVGRNVYDITISNNRVYCSKTGNFVYGILLNDTTDFERTSKNIQIKDNHVEHTTGGTSRAGILVQGMVYPSGYQAVISNLSIAGNTVNNFGNMTEGYAIGVQQFMPKDGSGNVTGSAGKDIIISKNNCTIAGSSGLINYGVFLNNLEKVNISDNIIEGFGAEGVRTLGMRHSIAEGNVLVANSDGAAARYGFTEQPSSPTNWIGSENNIYGPNVFQNLSAPEYFFRNESSRIVSKKSVRLAVATNRIIRGNDGIGFYAWDSMTLTGGTFTLDSASAFTIGDVIEIVNVGANAFTVNPPAVSIAAGARQKFYYNGSGSWSVV